MVYGTDAYLEWIERADRSAVDGTRARILVDGARAQRANRGGDHAESNKLALRAYDGARALNEPETVFWAASLCLMPTWPPEEDGERVKLATEVLRRPRDGVSSRVLSAVLLPAQIVFLVNGDRPAAEAVWRELDQLAARTRDATVVMWSGLMQSFRATLDGELEQSVEICDQVRAQVEELGLPDRQAGSVAFRPCIWLGRFQDALDRVTFFQQAGTRSGRQIVTLAYMGRTDEARDDFHRTLREAALLNRPDTPVQELCLHLELAGLLGERETAEILLKRLSSITASHPTVRYDLANVGRYLGGLALLLGDVAAAHEHYERGLSWATKIQYRPEIALTRLEIAELLLSPAYPSGRDAAQRRQQALQHLDFAVDEFRAMKMQPSLERAIRHKGLLHA